jgi:hypothetical protein
MTEGPPIQQRIRVKVFFHDGSDREVAAVSPGMGPQGPIAPVQYAGTMVLIHTARGGHEAFPERALKRVECIATGLAVPAGVQ